MDELLKKLKTAREAQEFYSDEMRAMVENFKKTPNYVLDEEYKKKADAEVAELEAKIRELALQEYAEKGEKKVHESVTVKIFKTFKVVDKSKVREWVLKNMPIAMQPDMKKVEEFAKEGNAVDGVEVGEEARAQIATKL